MKRGQYYLLGQTATRQTNLDGLDDGDGDLWELAPDVISDLTDRERVQLSESDYPDLHCTLAA